MDAEKRKYEKSGPPKDAAQSSDSVRTSVPESTVELRARAAGSETPPKALTAKQPARVRRMVFRKTSGIVFGNGLIELVVDHMQEAPVQLLLWNGSRAIIGARITVPLIIKSGLDSEPEEQPVTYDPVSLDDSTREAILFPSRTDSFGSSRQLFDELCAVIKQYTGLQDNFVSLAAHAARASWFPEAPNAPISLAICGPQSPQAHQLFLVLSCLYRRAVLVGNITPAALCSLPMDVSPSLFIEHYDDGPRLEKLLRATLNRGYIPFKGTLVRTVCTTVFRIDEPLIGTLAGRNIIEIPTAHPNLSLPILSPKVRGEIAEKFQPKLLMYRLANFRNVMNSTFDAATFAYPVNELARGLAACVVDDSEGQAHIMNLLSGKNEHAELDLSRNLRVTVLEALFNICHESDIRSIRVGDVTAAANAMLEQRGELSQMTSRMVGSKLHVLGFTTIRLDSAGRGLQLGNEMRMRIHSVAWDHRVAFPSLNDTQCNQCRELLTQKEGRDDGRIAVLSPSTPSLISLDR